MKKTFSLLLLIALSSNYSAQNADNMQNDSLIGGKTTLYSQAPAFSSKNLSSAIGIKYIGFGATILGAASLINNDPNSFANDDEDKIKLGRILATGGGVLSVVGQIIQDIQTLRLGREYSNTKTSNTSISNIKQGQEETYIPVDGFDGRIFHDLRNFSLFKLIKISDENVKDSAILISYWHDGNPIEIWIDPNSKKLVWDKKIAQ